MSNPVHVGLVLLALSGCQTGPVRHVAESPAVTVSQQGEVKLSGDAQTPAKVDTNKTNAILPIPEGSAFEFNEKLGTFRLVLAKATQMAVNRTETTIEGPKSFTPDKAPTIAEEKSAQSDYWVKLGLYACVLIGGAAAIFGLVRDWTFVMWGGVAIGGSALFGLFVQKHPILMLFIGVGAALIAAATILWHTRLKKLEQPPK